MLDHFDMQSSAVTCTRAPASWRQRRQAALPQIHLQLLFLLHPELRYRKKRAVEVFATSCGVGSCSLAQRTGTKAPTEEPELQQIDLATSTTPHSACRWKRQDSLLRSWRITFSCFRRLDFVGDWLRHTCNGRASPRRSVMVLKGKAQGVAPLVCWINWRMRCAAWKPRVDSP